MTQTSFAQEIAWIRNIPWPPDELLARLWASPDYFGAAELNTDSAETTSAADVHYAQARQDELVAAMLKSGEITLARLAQKEPGRAELLDSYSAIYRRFQLAGIEPERSRVLLNAAESNILVPVAPASDGGYINIRPFYLALDKTAVQARALSPERDREQQWRFCLNPPLREVPEVAARIVTLIDEHHSEVVFHYKFVDTYDDRMLGRTDKIIVYFADSEADAVLDILRRIKYEKPQLFLGRKLPGLYFPLEEGIGVASDTPTGDSFSTNRSRILAAGTEQAIDSGQDNDVARLRQAVARVALARGIDPINIALNGSG